MNRLITILIMLFLTATVLPGCGSEGKVPPNSPGENQSVPEQPKPDEPQISGKYNDHKNALTNFIYDYTSIKEPYWNLINEKDVDGTYTLNLLPFPSADLLICDIPMYDVLDITGSGSNRIEGPLPLNGFEGFKEIDGDIINFGYKHVWEESQTGLYQNGDILTKSGTFDMSKQELVSEEFTERDGKKTNRGIYELVLMPDSKYVGQSLYMNAGKPSSCVFFHVNRQDMHFIVAEGDDNIDAEYNSIIGKGDVPVEDMAQGYKTVLTVKISEGNVTFEQP